MGSVFGSQSSSAEETEQKEDTNYQKLPICYSDVYNIGFLGLENLHPFDSKKYEKIYNNLISANLVHKSQFIKPDVIDDATLKLVHPQKYLDSLASSTTVASMIEVPPVAILPNSWVDKQVLVPMKAATNGSIIASEMALKYGWAINLAGGYHHASAEDGGGFCIFADISLIIVNMRIKYGATQKTTTKNATKNTSKDAIVNTNTNTNTNSKTNTNNANANANTGTTESKENKEDELKTENDNIDKNDKKFSKFMIIDLDAHQGNGHENDKVNGIYKKYGANVFIFDVYNQWIYPGDSYAKGAINKSGHIRVNSNIRDKEYIKNLKERLPVALDDYKPDFVIYNAGTDCLEKDPLGQMSITEAGIVDRDFIVFNQVLKQRNIPMVMLLSGGYQQNNATVITRSITNLNAKFQLFTNPYQLKKAKIDSKESNESKESLQQNDNNFTTASPKM